MPGVFAHDLFIRSDLSRRSSSVPASEVNHRHTEEHAITEYLWFEEHLKSAAFKMPQTPKMVLETTTPDGVPRVTVTPDDSTPVKRVDIYYAVDPHALTRFWRDANAVKVGN